MKNWEDKFNEEMNTNPEYKELKNEGNSKTNRYVITKAGTILKYTGETCVDSKGEHLVPERLKPENDHGRVRIGGLRYSVNYLHRLYFPELYVKTKTPKVEEVIDGDTIRVTLN
jgi:hypothetical protein